MIPEHIEAHKKSIYHRVEIEASQLCGCFFCLKIFSPKKITDWVDGLQTALCPECNTDSVIGSISGYPINKEFLEKMEKYWFGLRKENEFEE